MSERDNAIRQAAFARLLELERVYRDSIPATEIKKGFVYGARKIAFKTMTGIFKPAVMQQHAALSITTTPRSPYDDRETEDEWLYAYRRGGVDSNDNRLLRNAMELRVPVIFFLWTVDSPRAYEAIWPCWIVEDRPEERCVRVQAGRHFVPDLEDLSPVPVDDEIERRYVTREVRTRVHQQRFRRAVLSAYNEHCLICRLREPGLLDASHIVGDADPKGVPKVSNGMALCAIHHRAFDSMLMTIDPDYRVLVSEKLLEDSDGPMLEHGIKDFHGKDAMYLPRLAANRPDREALEERLTKFF
jgi:putative restriction endonuclease